MGAAPASTHGPACLPKSSGRQSGKAPIFDEGCNGGGSSKYKSNQPAPSTAARAPIIAAARKTARAQFPQDSLCSARQRQAGDLRCFLSGPRAARCLLTLLAHQRASTVCSSERRPRRAPREQHVANLLRRLSQRPRRRRAMPGAKVCVCLASLSHLLHALPCR